MEVGDVQAVPLEMDESYNAFSPGSSIMSSLSISITSSEQCPCTSTPAPDLDVSIPVSSPMAPTFDTSPLSDLETSENPLSDVTQTVKSQSEPLIQQSASATPCQPPSRWSGFKIVGDNLDKSIKPSHMRSDCQAKSLHYFNSIAVKDHVDLSHLYDIPPSGPAPSLKSMLQNLLPSTADNHILRDNFAIHISRILAENMPFFHPHLLMLLTGIFHINILMRWQKHLK